MMKQTRNLNVLETCKRIPKGKIGLELGVWRGDTSELFLPLTNKLYLVDAWSIEPFKSVSEFGNFENYLKRYSKQVGSNNPEDFQKYYDKIYKSVVEKFKNTHIEIFRGTTKEFFNSFTSKVDWIYIDASHSYEGCLFDLNHSLSILNKNGIIFGDDYKSKIGVTKAVNHFVKENKLNFDWFAKSQYEIKI